MNAWGAANERSRPVLGGRKRVKLLSGPSLALSVLSSGPSRCYYLVQVCFLAYLKSGSKQVFAHSIIILCFFGAQLFGNFLKVFLVLQKRVRDCCICCFSNVSVLIFFSESVFYDVCKITSNTGVSATFYVFCCSKRRKQQIIENWNFWICFLPKHCRFVTVNLFFISLLKPYSYSVLGGAFFGPGCQKREILDPPKKGKENID